VERKEDEEKETIKYTYNLGLKFVPPLMVIHRSMISGNLTIS